jgi:hypothetical protein
MTRHRRIDKVAGGLRNLANGKFLDALALPALHMLMSVLQ